MENGQEAFWCVIRARRGRTSTILATNIMTQINQQRHCMVNGVLPKSMNMYALNIGAKLIPI